MRKSIIGLTAVLLSSIASPVFAQEEPAPAVTVTGGATVVSDYRFRGISQTDKKFAVQGTFTVAHESGFYATVWGSSIDDYVANGGDQEIDLIGGWAKDFNGTKLDVGVLYYYYPGSNGANTDFVEPYVAVSHTFGPVSAKVSAAYAPKAKALTVGNGKEDNLYTALDLGAAVPETPISLSAHLGHSFGPSYLTIGKEYTDWSVGASYTWNHLTFGVSYVDTDKSLFLTNGRNVSKAGVVGSVGVAF
ncbi:MAG: TorF family putative porin [Sphingobium sp.]